MNDQRPRHALTLKPVLCCVAGMDDVETVRDVEYAQVGDDVLTMDIYRPPDLRSAAGAPAVVFVNGYADAGVERMLGCKLKEMEQYVTWARLTAASGLTAITYSNVAPSDIHTLAGFLERNGESVGIDPRRLGLWACSGNGPLALSMLMSERRRAWRCAVLCYAFMLDLDDSTDVAEQADRWGFTNPCAGASVDDMAQDIPLFIARAGRDEFPGLNASIDAFASAALRRNLPVTLVNHAAAPHAFDCLHDSETTRAVVRQALAFMRQHLAHPEGAEMPPSARGSA